MLAALVFLDVNGVEDLPAPDELERITLSVAASEMTRSALAEWIVAQLVD